MGGIYADDITLLYLVAVLCLYSWDGVYFLFD